MIGEIDRFLTLQKQLREEILLGNKTWDDMITLYREFGMPEMTKDSMRRSFKAYDQYADKGWISQPKNFDIPNKEVIEYNAEKNVTTSDKIVSLDSSDINNPEVLLRSHGFNPEEFILISSKNSKWNQKGKNGIQCLYSSKITVKPKLNNMKSDLEDIKEYFKNYQINKRKEKTTYSNYEKNGECLLITMFDCHFGRFGYDDCTGESYDLNKAKERMITGAENFINKFKDRKFEEILIPIGQDFFNSEYNGATTSNKNPQDNCCDFRNIFKAGTSALIEVIELFKKKAPVKIIAVPGNHGYFAELAMFCVIEAYFKDDEDIKLDMSTSYRKYHLFGKNCLGFSHGSDEKERIWSLMPIEVPGYWAMADYRYYFTGHLHHLKVEEKQGIELWTIPAITSPDAWTSKMGFVSKAKAMCFIFDKQKGMVETHYMSF